MAPSLRDFQLALRSLRKTPLVSAIAILTLALGIGANTAVFSVVYAIHLKPVPYHRPDRLFSIRSISRQRNLLDEDVSAADYLDWKRQARSFTGMTACDHWQVTYKEKGVARRVDASEVSSDYFDVLGVRPLRGRTFLPEEDRPGSDDVVIVSDVFWRDALGEAPDIADKTIRLDSRPYRIAGVVPAAAGLPLFGADIFKPVAFDSRRSADRSTREFIVIGRLRDDVSRTAAEEEMRSVAQNIATRFPATNADWTTGLRTLTAQILATQNGESWVLFGAVAAVLLIACVNLACIFSARANARQREVATRLALGAPRYRLAQMLLLESMAIALIGGVAGIGLAYRALPVLIAMLPEDSPRTAEIAIAPSVLWFNLLVSCLVGVAFGLVPAFREARRDVQRTLQDSARGSSSGGRRRRILDGLIIAEVSISMVLLVGADLLLRSFQTLRRTDPGFRPENVLVLSNLVLPTEKYDTKAKRQEFFERVLERAGGLPGVVSAGGITSLPLQENTALQDFRIAGETPGTGGHKRAAAVNAITPDYFATMGIPVRSGRAIAAADGESTRRIALINDVAARQFFGDRDPIGQQIYLAGEEASPLEIVGVAGSSRQFKISDEPRPEIFKAFRQSDLYYLYVLVKTAGDAERMAELLRREVAAIDPDQPVGHRTLQQQFDKSLAVWRVLSQVLGLFAGLALILALLGVYGVTWYAMSQRTQEIGIRMALGAPPLAVAGAMVRRNLLLALCGIAAGTVLSAGLGGSIRHLLYGVSLGDPLVYAAMACLLLVAALLASLTPAWKAARIDPMVAMRQE